MNAGQQDPALAVQVLWQRSNENSGRPSMPEEILGATGWQSSAAGSLQKPEMKAHVSWKQGPPLGPTP
eukprot:3181849-Rhodomonas_salina.1